MDEKILLQSILMVMFWILCAVLGHYVGMALSPFFYDLETKFENLKCKYNYHQWTAWMQEYIGVDREYRICIRCNKREYK